MKKSTGDKVSNIRLEALNGMPADFPVDEQDVIHHTYYGKDGGDHSPFEIIPVLEKWAERALPAVRVRNQPF